MTTKFVTGKVRLSYPKIFKPEINKKSGLPQYSAQLLIPKTDKETLAKFSAATAAAVKQKYGDKPPAKLKLGDTPTPVPLLIKCPLRDGDEDNPKNRKELNGHWFVNCSSNVNYPPGVVDINKVEILDPSELYAGCYVRVALKIFCHDNDGISFGLNSVQKLADGERLDGRTSAADDFSDDWEDDEAY